MNDTVNMFRMWIFLLLVIFLFATLNPLQNVACLRIVRVQIGEHAIAGETVTLTCEFEMDGDELYSVKWYKSGAEFYRYLPKDHPKAQVYPADGINVDLKTSNDKVVTLKNVSLDSSGIYRCEVSAEAPSFSTVSEESEMNVIVIPEQSEITGVKANYEMGDQIKVNCTSRKSNPAAMLSWTINRNKAPRKYLQEFPVSKSKAGLETTTLGLLFDIDEEDNVRNGEIRLKCTATIAPIYYTTVEKTIVVGKSLASVLESKETPIHVRADQQNGDCSTSAAWWITAALSLLVKLFDNLEY